MHTVFVRMVAHQAKLLEACTSGLWRGHTEAIRQQLGPVQTTASAPPTPTKPP